MASNKSDQEWVTVPLTRRSKKPTLPPPKITKTKKLDNDSETLKT